MDSQGFVYYSVKKVLFLEVNYIKQDLSSLVEMPIRHHYLRKGLKQLQYISTVSKKAGKTIYFTKPETSFIVKN